MVMIDELAPFQKRIYTDVGFRRFHLARPGGLLQLMNELLLPGTFDCPLPMRALAPLLPLPSPTSAPAGRSLLAEAAGLCHRNEHTDTHTRAPGHHGTAAATAPSPSSPRSPSRTLFIRPRPNPFFSVFHVYGPFNGGVGKAF